MKSLSIDELLAQATEKSKPKIRCENNVGVQKYVERVGWTVGTYAIPTHVLFWHYRVVYQDAHITGKANKTVFFRTMSKKFPTCRKNRQRFYLLNEGIIEVTEQLIKDCKIYDRQHWQKKPRKKKGVQLPRQEGDNSN